MKLLMALLALSALLAAVTVWRAGVNEARAEATHPPAGAFVEVDGTRVHYVDEGQGPAVVLIHGSGGNLNDWTLDIVARLSDRYRVIAFDRPGLGYTEMMGRNASLAEQADLLAEASLALGAENPVVVGHSLGGAIAMAWAVERPDVMSGLVMLAGVSNLWDGGISTYYRLLSNPITGPIMANLIVAWVPERVVDDSVAAVFAPQSAPEGYGDHFGTGLTLRRFSMLENARHRATLFDQVADLVPHYPEIAVPAEILHGDADTTVGLHVHSMPLSEQIPDATLTVLEGVGHMPQHAAPEALAQAIDRLAARADLR